METFEKMLKLEKNIFFKAAFWSFEKKVKKKKKDLARKFEWVQLSGLSFFLSAALQPFPQSPSPQRRQRQ